MNYQVYYPSTPLRQFVEAYYVLECTSHTYKTQCTIPTGHPAVVFQYGNTTPTIEGHFGTLHCRSYISGVLYHPVYNKNPGVYKALLIFLQPLAAYYLFTVPQPSYVNQFVPLEDIIGASAQTMEAQLLQAHSNRECVRLVEAFLSGYAQEVERKIPLLEAATSYIETDSGNIHIHRLCAKCGCSQRTIERYFQQYLGVTPKRYARLVRLQRVYEFMKPSTPPDYSEIAYRLGFYDHAHLINEFKAFHGITPHSLNSDSLQIIQSFL